MHQPLSKTGRANSVITLRDPDTGVIVSSAQDPNSPQGVWRVQVQITPGLKTIPSNIQFNASYEFLVNGTPIGDGKITIYSRGALPSAF